MTYREIINRLEKCYDKGEARALARLVLEECFSFSLADIMCDKVNELSRDDSDKLEKIIQRLEKQEPVQYILGYQDFCGYRFNVKPGVLIPRPETEELISHLLTIPDLPQQVGPSPEGGTDLNSLAGSSPLRILDIGTGSGCIAISIALAAKTNLSTPPPGEGPTCWGRSGMVRRGLSGVYVEAWDISNDALHVAKENAERLGANVTFRKVDILNEQDVSLNQGSCKEFWSAIVSNPPYICQSESVDMEQNVLDHEPHLALFVPDDDPLLFYRAIASYGIKTLQPGGHLLFEINRAYGKEVCDLLQGLGYINVQLINDQFGNPRIVQAEVNV